MVRAVVRVTRAGRPPGARRRGVPQPAGSGFDAFALDIEATKVRSLPRRSARAVAVARAVRAALPPHLALGAITIDPYGGKYWNHYPFAKLATSVDLFLPMEYFTYRTKGPRRVAAYSRANVRLVRKLAGVPSFPVHPIGGDARAATLRELRAFLRASSRDSVVGVSLWEYGGTAGAAVGRALGCGVRLSRTKKIHRAGGASVHLPRERSASA